MCTSDSQIEKWLEELSLSGSETEDNLEEDFDSDDSLDDPNFEVDLEDEVENIILGNKELPLNSSTTVSSIDASQSNNQTFDSSIIKPSETIVRGKNNYVWSTIPSSAKKMSSRTPARNIVHIVQGAKKEFRDLTKPLECFDIFFTKTMIDEILLRTNEDINLKASNYKNQTATVLPARIEELRALLGILILSGALKNNHLSARELFDPQLCGSLNIATMSMERFAFLINCLHFDDKNTRENRKKTDKFAPIRNIWEIFIQQCRDNFKPGSYVTIDEQLLAFRGRCPFRMYIPSKPAKYGIKIVLICDVRTKYMFDASPYLGKNDNAAAGEPLGSYYSKLLTRTIHGTNRNVTADNWFTSIPIAEQLLADPYKLTLIGTLKANKKEIPEEFKHNSSRLVGTSMFGFHDKLSLVSFKAKPNKTVFLISTMHDEPKVNSVSKKPLIIESYNETKGAVNTYDQMCCYASCSRKTRRWPLCMFYGMLNMAVLNSYILYVSNCDQKKKIKAMSRRDFMKDLSKDLCYDWRSIRLKERPSMRKRVRQAIVDSINTTEDQEENSEPEIKKGKRSMCNYCPSSKKRMSVYYCAKCNKTYCMEHRSPNCYQDVRKKV